MDKIGNNYAKALFIMGWIIIVGGLIGSVVLGEEYGRWGINWTVFLIGALSSVMSGLLILGLGEIINILDDNRKYLKKLTQESKGISNGNNSLGIESSELPDI